MNTPVSESTLEEELSKIVAAEKEDTGRKKKRNQYYGYSIYTLDQMIQLECSTFEENPSNSLNIKHLSKFCLFLLFRGNVHRFSLLT